jgi:hypothetical protein
MSRCYVGRCKCGSVVAAVVDEPGREKQTAKDVAEFIKEGLAVEQMDTKQVRVTIQSCACPKDTQLELGVGA